MTVVRLKGLLCAVAAGAGMVVATGSSNCMAQSALPAAKGALAEAFRLGADGMSIETPAAPGSVNSGSCRLSTRAWRARLSFDGLTLFVSENGYVPVQELRTCGAAPVQVLTTPAVAGLLEDVNTFKSLYVGLLPVSTQPISYLAVVGRIGSTKNLSSLPGAYLDSLTKRGRQQRAFVYADEAGPFAKISLDGRYVSVNGKLDCSRDAYPGIWDLPLHRKVVLKGNPQEQELACQQLFAQPVAR